MRRSVITPDGWHAPQPGFSWVVALDYDDRREVHIAGQVALDGDRLVGAGDVSRQAECCFQRIAAAVTAAGGTMADLVESRTYLLDIADLPQVAAVRMRYLADPPPTSTALGVTGFAVAGALIEIEAKAVIERTTTS